MYRLALLSLQKLAGLLEPILLARLHAEPVALDLADLDQRLSLLHAGQIVVLEACRVHRDFVP